MKKRRHIAIGVFLFLCLLSMTISAEAETSVGIEQASAAGDQIRLTCSQALDPAIIPDINSFSVTINQASLVSPTSIIITENLIKVVLPNPVQAGDDLTITYTPADTPIKDLNGNLLAGFTDYPVSNTTVASKAPELQKATATKSQIRLSYDQPLNPASIPDPSDIIIKVNSEAGTIPSVISINNNQVIMALTSAIKPGDQVSISYSPGINPIENQNGQPASALDKQPITNTVIKITHFYYYDSSNHLIRIKNENSQKCRFEYDRNGNLLRRR